jgi:aminoglycoside phosphotransferase (APT) family kinase protein
VEGSGERPAGIVTGQRPAARTLAAALDAYFQQRGLGVRARQIIPILGGFETYIYRLELAAAPSHPSAPVPAAEDRGWECGHPARPRGDAPDGRDARAPRFDPIQRTTPAQPDPETHKFRPAQLPIGVPLILRLGWRADAAGAVRWESQAMTAARAAGIPAPRVYLVEPDLPGLGGAVMLMEFARGVRVDQASLRAGIVDVVRMIRAYARMQATIYRVPWRPMPEMLPSFSGSVLAPAASLEQRLAWFDAEIEARGLTFLRPVLHWLQGNRGAIAGGQRVFLHGDYHPLNVFVDKRRVSAVIDWSASGFGDRHEDIGWSSLIIATATSADAAEDRRYAVFRSVGRWLYLGFLHSACRLDRAALRYGEVEAALRWLLIFLPSYLPNAGPPILNADAPAFTIPRYVLRVQRFIEKRTRLRLTIPLPVIRDP